MRDGGKGRTYRGVHEFTHEAVNHSVSEYVSNTANSNRIESFWATLRSGYHGTFHHMSPQHLHRYVNEFARRHKIRYSDINAQMQDIVAVMIGKRLMYSNLVGEDS